MDPRTVKKILNDTEVLDIKLTAEAVLDEARRNEKKSRPRSPANSLKAWMRHKAYEKEKEAFRQDVAKAWKKTHSSS